MKNLLEVSSITEWYYEHFIWVLYWEVKVTVSMCSHDAWLDQFGESGACPLICWHMPYVCASSKMKELMCTNGYPWWCVKQLLSFKVSPSKLFTNVATGPNLSLTTDHMTICSYHRTSYTWNIMSITANDTGWSRLSRIFWSMKICLAYQ